MPQPLREIIKIIESLKTKGLHGYDEISVKLLSFPFIISPLTHICNKMLSSGIFPDRLIINMLRSGHYLKRVTKKNPCNYRLIFLFF
jgi:hypothetical protein